jgi:hypothetical protein
MKRESKLAIALAFLQANPGATSYQAAKHARMTPTSLYAYLRRQQAAANGKCPTCGQAVSQSEPVSVQADPVEVAPVPPEQTPVQVITPAFVRHSWR